MTKPTNQEWVVITAMVFGAAGLVLGTLTSNSRLKELQQERDELLIHAEKLLEINQKTNSSFNIFNFSIFI